jgi:hypothetical protein
MEASYAGSQSSVGSTKEGQMKLPLLPIPILLEGAFAFSTAAAATNLIGDVIFAPCADCDAIEQYEYSVNPFTVDAVSQETALNIIDGDLDTGVDFHAASVVLTFQQDTTWLPYAFNGPEFSVLTGSPFGSVVSATSPAGEPVDAYVSRGSSTSTGRETASRPGTRSPSPWARPRLQLGQ